MIDIEKVKIDPAWALKIPPAIAIRRQVLPISVMNGILHVACNDLQNSNGLRAVEKAVNMPIQAELVEANALKESIKKIYGGRAHNQLVATQASDGEDTVQLSNSIIDAAMIQGASDIHIDPDKDELRIRFRVDGRMELFQSLPQVMHSSLMSRLKVLAHMDIAEKRIPQDGYIKHQSSISSQLLEIRVATLPTKYGERMTMRLMAMGTEGLTVEKLGMSKKDFQILEKSLAQPHGMILLTGPTGSGKTTTLYGALRELMKTDSLNIITIEDPIEFDLNGVAQVEIDNEKMTFSSALKSVLRHDPDVVMIGEIRDQETASIAIKAAITGHLVLSTLHTNSAPSVITRLIDMGVERFLVAATVRLAAAQRLVRGLCQDCKYERKITALEAYSLKMTDLEGSVCYEAKGCLYCAGKGHLGRIGLFEMLQIDDEISRLISSGCEEAELFDQMSTKSMNSLLQDGLEKILHGQTTVQEVLRVCSSH